MCFTENNNAGNRGHISEDVNVINVFHDVNSILSTVTNSYPQDRYFTKLLSIFFCSKNLALLIF